jgi:hypothetical protein
LLKLSTTEILCPLPVVFAGGALLLPAGFGGFQEAGERGLRVFGDPVAGIGFLLVWAVVFVSVIRANWRTRRLRADIQRLEGRFREIECISTNTYSGTGERSQGIRPEGQGR